MKTYPKRKMYIVGKDDVKIHKILDARVRCIFEKSDIRTLIFDNSDIDIMPLSDGEEMHLLSHSIFPNNVKDHIVIRFNMGYIELAVGDVIFIDNLDFYITRANMNKSRIKIKFRFLTRIRYFVSYSSAYLNDRIGL